jgi:hypothetical protein
MLAQSFAKNMGLVRVGWSVLRGSRIAAVGGIVRGAVDSKMRTKRRRCNAGQGGFAKNKRGWCVGSFGLQGSGIGTSRLETKESLKASNLSCIFSIPLA